MSLGLKKLTKEARDAGFNEQVNKAISNYLASLGHTGDMNKQMYDYISTFLDHDTLTELLYHYGVDWTPPVTEVPNPEEPEVVQRIFNRFTGSTGINEVGVLPITAQTVINTPELVIENDIQVDPSNQADLIILELENPADSSSFFGIRLDVSFIKIYSNSHTPGQGTKNVRDGKLHRIKTVINLSTGFIQVFVDNVLDYTVTHLQPSKLIQLFSVRIGSSGSSIGLSYRGIIANLRITLGGLDAYVNALATDVGVGVALLYTKNAQGNWVDPQSNILEVAY